MSSKRGGSRSNKGKNVVGVSDIGVDQLNQAVQDVDLDKKNKKRSGNVVASKHGASQAPKLKPWGQPDTWRNGRRRNVQVRAPKKALATQTGGRGGANNQAMNRYPYGNIYNGASNAIPPPLQTGRNWNSRLGNAWQSEIDARRANVSVRQGVEEDDDHNDNDELHESEFELLLHSDDEYYSNESPKSHEEQKQNRWYADFFETLDSLTIDQINEPTRQWHCPACQNGPGAIDWYCSLQALVGHAKTKASKRVKIHRDLAQVLEEELRIQGANVNPAGESYGQWKGLNEVVKDKEIVWPPMVMNEKETLLSVGWHGKPRAT